MQKLKIRHDDFDLRLKPEQYIELHEKFIEYDLIETAVLQLTRGGRVVGFDKKLIDYMTAAPNWDIQLHGWGHEHYSEMEYDDIFRDMAAAIYCCQKIFKVTPTVWYPPWNCFSEKMKVAADDLGLEIDNESYDITQFIREMSDGTFEGHSVYFHLWEQGKRYMIDSMLYWARIYENSRPKKHV